MANPIKTIQHIVIETPKGHIQHLNKPIDSPRLAMQFIENAVLDELEALNDCKLTQIGEAIVKRFYAKPDGNSAYIIYDRNHNNAFVARYAVYDCDTFNTRDGRHRWVYRGHAVNTNSRNNRYCVDYDSEHPKVLNSLIGALAHIDELVLVEN